MRHLVSLLQLGIRARPVLMATTRSIRSTPAGYTSFCDQSSLEDNMIKSEHITSVRNDFSDLIHHVSTSSSSNSVVQLRDMNDVVYLGRENPEAIVQFSDVDFPDYIQDWLTQSGFQYPTSLQAQTLPLLLKGSNFLGVGSVSCGKTLAYILPGLLHVEKHRDMNPIGPQMIVIFPSSVLSSQAEDIIKSITSKSQIVVGNLSNEGNLEHTNICLGTPDQFLSAIGSKNLNIENCSYLVMDNFDVTVYQRKTIPHIIDLFQENESQIVLMAESWTSNQSRMLPKIDGLQKMAFHSAKHYKRRFILCEEEELNDQTMELLRVNQDVRILIFVNSIIAAVELQNLISSEGLTAALIHRHMPDNDVIKSLTEFNSEEKNILISTQIPASAFNVKDVGMVINSGMPLKVYQYRDRALKAPTGECVSLVTPNCKLTPDKVSDEDIHSGEKFYARCLYQEEKPPKNPRAKSEPFSLGDLTNAKPSEILHRLQTAAKKPNSTDIFMKELFLLLLPRRTRDVVSTTRDFATLEQMAQMAESLSSKKEYGNPSSYKDKDSLDQHYRTLKKKLEHLEDLRNKY